MSGDRSAFIHWDAEHYLFLARHGYGDAMATTHNPAYIAFLPVYPKLVGLLGGGLGAALCVSWLSAMVFFWGLYRLAEREFTGAGRAAVVTALIFPSSYFFGLPYTEALFAALSVWALVWARRPASWAGFGAAILSGFASGTRLPGLLLYPAIVWGQSRPRPIRARAIGASCVLLILGCSGFLFYLGLNALAAGSPFAFLDIQSQRWGRALAWPWSGGWAAVTSFRWRGGEEYLYVGLAEFLAGVLLWLTSIAAVVMAVRRRWSSELAVVIVGVTLMATSSLFWLSNPRLILSAPPVFVLWGQALRSRWALGNFRGLVWRVAIIATGAVSVGLQIHFLRRYLDGAWAF